MREVKSQNRAFRRDFLRSVHSSNGRRGTYLSALFFVLLDKKIARMPGSIGQGNMDTKKNKKDAKVNGITTLSNWLPLCGCPRPLFQ